MWPPIGWAVGAVQGPTPRTRGHGDRRQASLPARVVRPRSSSRADLIRNADRGGATGGSSSIVTDLAGPTKTAALRSPGGACLWAVIGLIPGIALVTWWVVGDISVHASTDPVFSYEASQPTLAPGLQAGLGCAGCALALLCFVTLVRTRRTFDPLWWVLVGAVVGVGGLAGLTERVATAGVVGTNLGSGLAVLVGLPVLGLAAVGLVALAIRLSTTQQTDG
jgi:hypothetical protein